MFNFLTVEVKVAGIAGVFLVFFFASAYYNSPMMFFLLSLGFIFFLFLGWVYAKQQEEKNQGWQ